MADLATALVLASPRPLSLLGRCHVLHAALSGATDTVRIPLRRGTLHFDPTSNADWQVYREIFVRRQYATDYRHAVVIDIGAHRGLFAAYVMAWGAAAVHCYEPERQNFAYLKATLRSLGSMAGKCHAYRQAVSGEAGSMTMYMHSESWSHSLVQRTDKAAGQPIDVEVVSLREVIERVRGTSARLIVKVDAEGAEFPMLLQARPVDLEQIDELFVEVHAYAGHDPLELRHALMEAGFVLRRMTHEGAHTVWHLRQSREEDTDARF